MAQPPRRPWLRVLVPLLILLGGVGVFWSVARNTGAQRGHSAPASPTTPGPSTPTNEARNPPAASGSKEPPHGASPPAAQTAAPAGGTPPPAAAPEGLLDGLHARDVTGDPAAPGFEPLGAVDNPDQRLRLEFSPYGAGVRSITLAAYYNTLRHHPDNHVVIQSEKEHRYLAGGEPPQPRRRVLTPLGIEQITINGIGVSLAGRSTEAGNPDRPVWRQLGPGRFEAVVVNGSGREIVRVLRTYALVGGRHAFTVRQSIENLTDAPLRIQVWQYGPVDLTPDQGVYGGDRRRVRFGYLAKPALDPTRQIVSGADYATLERKTVLSRADRSGGWSPGSRQWPRPESIKNEQELVWVGMTNRYFGIALYPLIDPSSRAGSLPGPDKVFRAVEAVFSAVLDTTEPLPERVQMALQVRTDERTVAAGASMDLSMGVYAGPLLESELSGDPVCSAAGLDELVVYNLGGACGWCTFAWLAHLLLGLLHVLHDYLVRDWALAIVMLVLIVRTILHPVTRWSQVRMARFGKQLQELAPKQKKLQEKYKDDPKRLREEIGKLFREEGVSPTGMLGCLPAFLQTPVWIALYAMLFFAFELRQQAAFFGLFQGISGGRWWFLGDLAEPDRFISFGRSLFTVPLLGIPFDSINVLPVLLGVVFYIQQKYLTPPTSATLSPEQEQTQKIAKVMMVVMFPVFMYGAPSGLALYFITNSTLGILESKWIRSHMDRHDLLNPKKKPAAGGPGFFARLQAAAEERRKLLEQARSRQQRRRP